MKLKQIARVKLTDALNSQAGMLKPDLFFITSFRATKDGTIQVEVCQNRNIAGRKRTLIGMVNKSDKRFRGTTTLLFDWMKLEPQDLLNTFPSLQKEVTIEDLKAISESYDAEGPKGSKALVFQAIHSIPEILDVESGEKVHPIIAVTEVTHSQLVNGEFYRGENADEKISNELENGTAIMKTSSDDDADFIVDSETGDKIYRFTRTVIMEDYPKKDWDTIIPNKTTLSIYNKSKTSKSKGFSKPEDLVLDMEEADSI